MKDMNINLWYDSKEALYYLINQDIICSECGQQIENLVFFQTKYMPSSELSLFCEHCFTKGKAVSQYAVVETCVAIVSKDFLPTKNCHKVVFRPPQLHNSNNLSVFQINEINKEFKNSAPKIIDRTKLAGRNHRNLEIEKKIKQRELEYNQENERLQNKSCMDVLYLGSNLESNTDLDSTLNNIINSQIISHDNQLEDKTVDNSRLLENKKSM